MCVCSPLLFYFDRTRFLSTQSFFPQQTQVIAAAAAGVAAEGLAPKDAKAGAENAAQLSVFLVENAIVILMLVEDHLRLQRKQTCATIAIDASPSPLSLVSSRNRTSTLTAIGEASEISSSRASLLSDSGKVPLDVSGKHFQTPCWIGLSNILLLMFSFQYEVLLKNHAYELHYIFLCC